MKYIVSHFDWDGWCSAAILSRSIDVNEITFISNKALFKVLNYFTRSLKNNEKNFIFILDLSITKDMIQKLLYFFRKIEGKNVKFIWIDHHKDYDAFKFINAKRQVELFINPEAITAASMIGEFIPLNKDDNEVSNFIRYAEAPNDSDISKYWYKVLTNLKRIRIKSFYFTISKILFGLFKELRKDIISDYFFNLQIKYGNQNDVKLDYFPNSKSTCIKTSKNHNLLFIENMNSRSELFKKFNGSHDLMLVSYNDDTMGCYSKELSLKSLFSVFNAKGHEKACVFKPYIQTGNNFTKYLTKKEVIDKIKEIY